MVEERVENDSVLMNEIKLLLAEKRTSLAVMRTGIAVLALPLSVLSLLIATSKYYDILNVLNFLIPLVILNLILLVIGGYLIVHSNLQMRRYDRLIQKIKLKHSVISDYIV